MIDKSYNFIIVYKKEQSRPKITRIETKQKDKSIDHDKIKCNNKKEEVL